MNHRGTEAQRGTAAASRPHSKRFAMIGALLIFGTMWKASLPAATVDVYLTNYNSGVLTNVVIITPVTERSFDGSYLVAGLPTRYTPTNGNDGWKATAVLAKGNYDLKLAGLTFRTNLVFAVPSGTNRYSVDGLWVSGGNAYNYSPGVQEVTNTASVTVTGNGKGSVGINVTAVPLASLPAGVLTNNYALAAAFANDVTLGSAHTLTAGALVGGAGGQFSVDTGGNINGASLALPGASLNASGSGNFSTGTVWNVSGKFTSLDLANGTNGNASTIFNSGTIPDARLSTAPTNTIWLTTTGYVSGATGQLQTALSTRIIATNTAIQGTITASTNDTSIPRTNALLGSPYGSVISANGTVISNVTALALSNSYVHITETRGTTNVPLSINSTNVIDNVSGQHITVTSGVSSITSSDNAFAGLSRGFQITFTNDAHQMVIVRVINSNLAWAYDIVADGLGTPATTETASTQYRINPPIVKWTDNNVGTEGQGGFWDDNGMPWLASIGDQGAQYFLNFSSGTVGYTEMIDPSNVGLTGAKQELVWCVSSQITNNAGQKGSRKAQLGVHSGAPPEAAILLPNGTVSLGTWDQPTYLEGITNRYGTYSTIWSVAKLPTGLASFSTNSYSVSTTGYTNSSLRTIRVMGLTGTSIVHSNALLATSFSRGTITVPTDIVLQPNETIKGTSVAAQGVQDF